MGNFYEQVYELVTRVPKGKVASYGQVAAALGRPRAARQVGQALKHLGAEGVVPWWRVVNSRGYISLRGNWEASKELQCLLLKQEGVEVGEDYTLDINKYRYFYKA